ncbi:heme/hemin ABC transporter substrate-binding protein [Brucella intermedia]|uniref:ABC transporter substrate-binding protein n=2 Tax=Pseudomonadota TaxID=1224 RepID=A0A7V6PBV0_9HYPH|nr:ABC transporter substrate-binding protein [Brucella intermedia]PJR88503.1 hemin ABC transporter substrate-binding protein [Ochrobactrum sp. 721/2009]PJT14364.1 hemin ABC transporter substrate-binding protein [Ochrobactrum sp. 720/2009]PJT22569.1 hemin ABC transporter substrate-binding protein [Ochrobactrum sp. 715/2009]PJT28869.1 hemin ABC transporter substrate-binding protein [Ochrobactrum sp. 695/2009]PJT34157.1 hemin ABC transporter substrate-binding protein [Ochrobactrum sp. 689/2009]
MSFISLRLRHGAALVAIALSLATGAASADTVDRFTDTSRIVSVGGSLTEIVYALGAENMLAGRDQTSIYPEAVKKLADVGYMRQLAPEGVLSVNPTGILLLEGSGPQDTLDVLNKASVPMIVVPETFTGESVIRKIEIVGKALGLEDKAQTLAAEISSDIEAAEKAAAGHNPRKRVLFVLSAPGGRLMASGTGTAADGMIKLAGGENVVSEYHGYKQLTDEAVEKTAPDMILIMDTGADGMTPESLMKNPVIAATPAGRNGNIVSMEASYLLGFGPRTGAAIRDLSAKLYGAPAGQ